MIRGVARNLFQNARQMRRMAARHAQKQQRVRMRQNEGTRRTACDLKQEQSVITNHHKQIFVHAQYTETITRILAMGAISMLDIGAIDALNTLLQDVADDDDDGR